MLTQALPLSVSPSVKPALPGIELLSSDPKNGLRLRLADRSQVQMPCSLDDLLPEDHRARAIWALVAAFDTSSALAPLRCRLSNAGAPAIDPRISLALWVYGVSVGIASAREIARRSCSEIGSRWISGGVSVSYHHVSSFRVHAGELFSKLVTQVLGLAMQHKLLSLDRVSQDGTRVRASAGENSFLKAETLEVLEKEAQSHLAAVLAEANDPRVSNVARAAKKRGARDFLDRVQRAKAQIPELQAAKDHDAQAKGRDRKEARSSTTDSEARVMKMGKGEFCPAYNIQFAATTDAARMIVGIEASNSVADQGKALPMLKDIVERTGQTPKELLTDGGIATLDTITVLAVDGVKVFSPLKKPSKGQRPSGEPRASDSPAVAEWRARMQTPEAKKTYRLRAATSETVNADAKTHRGLDRLTVRGLQNVLSAASLFALTYNILRYVALTTP